jgi:transcriptional regulator with XRE-family HTH domain
MIKNRQDIETIKLQDMGLRLRGLRVALNITLEKMNDLTGISKSYISDFERGRKLPSSKYLFFLIEKFAIDINYIYTGRGEMFLHSREEKNTYDFGKFDVEINDLLYHIIRVPNALFSVLGFFSDYKINKENFIKKYLEKIAEKDKENNGLKEKEE